MSNFEPLKIVGRGSETQLQVGENINKYHGEDSVKPKQCRQFTGDLGIFYMRYMYI